jgi:hypothetical protein
MVWSLVPLIGSGPGSVMKTKDPEVLPDWLRILYATYGEPKVKPNPPEGVRFFHHTRWVTRRMWMWSVGRINPIHHRFYIDQCSDHYETVAESDDVDKPRVELKTPWPPTEEEIIMTLSLAHFR